MAMREFKSKPGRKTRADPAAVRAWLEANDFDLAGAAANFNVKLQYLKEVNREYAKLMGLVANPNSKVVLFRKWTQEDQDRVMALLHGGATRKQIATLLTAEFGRPVTYAAVNHIRRRAEECGAPVAAPPTAPTPLSPAMRHLAQFDPIIRQRLALEQAQ